MVKTMSTVTEADRALARDLWARGYSLAYIAARLGVSRRAVVRMVGRADVAWRGVRRWTRGHTRD